MWDNIVQMTKRDQIHPVIGREIDFDDLPGTLEAIGWSLGARIGELDQTRPFDIAYRVEREEFRGKSTLQARLSDFRVL